MPMTLSRSRRPRERTPCWAGALRPRPLFHPELCPALQPPPDLHKRGGARPELGLQAAHALVNAPWKND